MITSPSSRNADRVLHERVRADDQMHRSRGELRLRFPPFLGRGRAGEERHAKPRGLEEAPNRDEVLLRQDLGRRHERHLEPVLHGDERGQERDDGLAAADVALQQPVHWMQALHVGDDLGKRLLLIAGQAEWQNASRGLAHLVGDHDRARLALAFRAPLPEHEPELEEEELLEDQSPLRRRSKSIELVDVGAGWREMRVGQRGPPFDQMLSRPQLRWKRIGKRGGQLRQRVVHEHALHLGGQRAGFLVDRHDPPGVKRVVLGDLAALLIVWLLGFEDLYCGFCSCSPCDVSSRLPNRITRW